MRRRNPIRWRG